MLKRISLIFIIVFSLGATIYAQPVSSLTIPSKVEFAGKTIALDRYDLRERFDREQLIIAYNHATSILIVKRANRYFPIIEPILQQNGIPDDFKYLAVIESMLDPRAISPAKAAGLWQLMPQTAEQLGLEVNDEVDERYHLEKATQAACRYFKSAYNKFKSWTSVAASYNGGMGRITEELDKQQCQDALDIQIGPEISRYVFRILAMKQFLQNPKAFGFELKREDFYPTVRVTSVIVKDSIPDFTRWAQQYGLSYYQLKDFNIWLRDRKLVNKNHKQYQINLPMTEDLNYSKNKIFIHNPLWVVF